MSIYEGISHVIFLIIIRLKTEVKLQDVEKQMCLDVTDWKGYVSMDVIDLHLRSP